MAITPNTSAPESFLKNDKRMPLIDLDSIKGGEAESFLKNPSRSFVFASPDGGQPCAHPIEKES